MGYHKLSNHEDHWSKSGHLPKFMVLKRYDQIHHYFSLQDTIAHLKEKKETFT